MINYPDGDFDFEEGTNAPAEAVEPFPNLRAAGQALAAQLQNYRGQENTIVLALAMGGVLVGDEVAKALELPFDLILLRRLLAPNGPGSSVCAASVAGVREIVGDLPPHSEVPATGFDFFIADTFAAFDDRQTICRGSRPVLDVAGQTVLLVDCGARTGSTMATAIHALRARNVGKIVAAQPTASLGAARIFRSLADEFVCLHFPRPYGNVGVWYRDFTRPKEDQLAAFLR